MVGKLVDVLRENPNMKCRGIRHELQKFGGLVECIAEMVPHAINRKCARYIYANLRQIQPGVMVKKLFWGAARAYNAPNFNSAMLVLRNHKPTAYVWLMNIKVSLWARHSFNTLLKNDHIKNNISKSFNNWIGELRSKPIITLLDGLRFKLISRVSVRYKRAKIMEHFKCIGKFNGVEE
ncbi:UNVERIFIED_CONTAM: hypothetical protein Sradi_4150400 [Sesamum radiatum]|uniref:Uncharacterized protein n=1 Tax=Sesamum radiatum TaxID=300843 RepID=A0AAW2P1Q4_SESRA